MAPTDIPAEDEANEEPSTDPSSEEATNSSNDSPLEDDKADNAPLSAVLAGVAQVCMAVAFKSTSFQCAAHAISQSELVLYFREWQWQQPPNPTAGHLATSTMHPLWLHHHRAYNLGVQLNGVCSSVI